MNEQEMNPIEQEARTFSQQDVDHIVSQRVTEEKARAATLLQQKDQEIEAFKLQYQTTEELTARGWPADLMEIMDYTNRETFLAMLEKLDGIVTAKAKAMTDERLKGSSFIPKDSRSSGFQSDTVRSAMGLNRKD